MKKLLFTISAYRYLETAFLATGDYDRGELHQEPFPDGEIYRRVVDDAWGRDVVLLGGTPTDADWLELYDFGSAISRAGARSLSIVMPYFGYSTMERAVKPGEVVTAKTRARLISSIPPCEGGTRTFLFDLHTDGIEFYFSDSHTTHHVYGAPIVTEAIASIASGKDFVLGATDAGRAKWVESLARSMHCEPAFVYKRRDPTSGDLTVTGVNADVKGKCVVIYDDMIRTGGSLLQAAEAYKSAGATEVHAMASHLVLPGDALDRLNESGLVASVNGTDSHPRSQAALAAGGHVVSVAGLLAREVGRS
ncbi:MAG TPA: ribose-phosphate pyrophosphokinase [Polyangiaceae bacterium]|nr:ribose-phosphate pyrophosphokinase [Polyangiaceae bacterium]